MLERYFPSEIAPGVLDIPTVTDEMIISLKQRFSDLCPDFTEGATAFDIAMQIAEMRGVRSVIQVLEMARHQQQSRK